MAFKSFQSIYDITIQTLDGSTVSLNNYNGKRIVILEFDPANYDEMQLRMLDTLEKTNNNIRVIVVSAKDFSVTATNQMVQNIVTNLNLSFTVTQLALVKKSAEAEQQSLFKWLTHVEENSHFDNDADQPGQLYIVNESGTLYTMLQPGTPNSLAKELITQQTN
jgi:glutathione peroxidase-family protein